MPIEATPDEFRLMAEYGEQLIELARSYARKGLDYVQIERATIQSLLNLNWEFNVDVQIKPLDK